MLQKGVPVELPVTTNPDKKPDNENQMIISIKQDSTIYIEQNWVPKNEFVGQMKEMHDRNPSKEILIKADGRLRYKDVKRFMDMINEAGFENVGLITEKMKDTAQVVRFEVNYGNGSWKKRIAECGHQCDATRGRGAGVADHLHGV